MEVAWGPREWQVPSCKLSSYFLGREVRPCSQPLCRPAYASSTGLFLLPLLL